MSKRMLTIAELTGDASIDSVTESVDLQTYPQASSQLGPTDYRPQQVVPQDLPEDDPVGRLLAEIEDEDEEELSESSPEKAKRLWQDTEDRILIDRHKGGERVTDIAKYLPNRSVGDCIRRFEIIIEGGDAKSAQGKRKPFTPDEDSMILKGKKKNMTWKQIGQTLPGRTQIACQRRWQVHLRTMEQPPTQSQHASDEEEETESSSQRKPLSWQHSEDEILISRRKDGQGFHEIAEHLSNRTASSCASRLERLVKRGVAGVELTIERRFWTRDEDSVVRKGRQDGKSYEEIVELLDDRPWATVYRRWRDYLRHESDLDVSSGSANVPSTENAE